jgi:hypothetical protein
MPAKMNSYIVKLPVTAEDKMLFGMMVEKA